MNCFSTLKFVLVLGGLFLSMSASAALVTFNFTALVTANNPLGPASIPPIGGTFNGGFTIDTSNTSGVGSNCVAISNCWSDAATSWSWNGTTTQLGSPATIANQFKVDFSIIDSVAGSGLDKLTISLKGNFFTGATLYFTDSSGSAFESATTLLPSLSSFDSATYQYVLKPACATPISCHLAPKHSGDITALSPAVVPLPAAAWLFGSALLGLGAAKRRKA